MKIFKRRGMLLLLIVALISSTLNVSAASVSTDAVYDLEKGGVQEFMVQDENGELQKIIVEEIRTSRVSDGSYKVTYQNTGFWDAGFYVTISSNQITKVYSPFYFTYIGEITAPILTKNSVTKATYAFVYTKSHINFQTGVIATISNKNLVVSKK